MIKEELDRLESIAMAATPGPWKVDEGSRIVCHGPTAFGKHFSPYDYGGNEWYLLSWMDEKNRTPNFSNTNAAHIAAFNPSTALKLIGDLRKAIEALEFYAELEAKCAWQAEMLERAREIIRNETSGNTLWLYELERGQKESGE